MATGVGTKGGQLPPGSRSFPDEELIDITKGEQYSSWFLEINPRGEIPVLKVENTIIPDSHELSVSDEQNKINAVFEIIR